MQDTTIKDQITGEDGEFSVYKALSGVVENNPDTLALQGFELLPAKCNTIIAEHPSVADGFKTFMDKHKKKCRCCFFFFP